MEKGSTIYHDMFGYGKITHVLQVSVSVKFSRLDHDILVLKKDCKEINPLLKWVTPLTLFLIMGTLMIFAVVLSS